MENGELRAIILAGGRGKRMKSDLPKVLHELRGKPMIQHSIDNIREAGIDDVMVVVGYRRDMVMANLRETVRFAIQEEQLGTGHAVQQALPFLADAEGSVVICYGDMPLLSPKTIRTLVETQRRPGIVGSVLTVVLDNPPAFGRIVRNERGGVDRIVEVKDCTPDELKIKEVNVGVYCLDAAALRTALPRLNNNNAQGEYYLTDVVQVFAQAGWSLETVRTDNLEETLGINDVAHLKFAEQLEDIAYAESLYELIDAAIALERSRPTTSQ
ncbi:MAG: NTP transferase domain-containing protein [Actinomycetota bacterium]|jgi:bifunctional UDP-N-acetylglucosamine pyrophosphorylase/glucosamine-1-phosphate N-acetyltransferase|nr:NTP transferase domain-containing protein [Actinomycetota bacterium]